MTVRPIRGDRRQFYLFEGLGITSQSRYNGRSARHSSMGRFEMCRLGGSKGSWQKFRRTVRCGYGASCALELGPQSGKSDCDRKRFFRAGTPVGSPFYESN